MKVTVLISFFFIHFYSSTQEFNLGLETGTTSNVRFTDIGININGAFEYKPSKAFFSLNSNPGIIIADNSVIGTFPLYFKFVFGERFNICPSLGGFYWTVNRGGWLAGVDIEIPREKFIPFISANYLQVYYEDYIPHHFGGGEKVISSLSAIKLAIGVKYKLFNHAD